MFLLKNVVNIAKPACDAKSFSTIELASSCDHAIYKLLHFSDASLSLIRMT